jgi:hypothetical protein
MARRRHLPTPRFSIVTRRAAEHTHREVQVGCASREGACHGEVEGACRPTIPWTWHMTRKIHQVEGRLVPIDTAEVGWHPDRAGHIAPESQRAKSDGYGRRATSRRTAGVTSSQTLSIRTSSPNSSFRRSWSTNCVPCGTGPSFVTVSDFSCIGGGAIDSAGADVRLAPCVAGAAGDHRTTEEMDRPGPHRLFQPLRRPARHWLRVFPGGGPAQNYARPSLTIAP